MSSDYESGEFELLEIHSNVTLKLTNKSRTTVVFIVSPEKYSLMWTEPDPGGSLFARLGIEWFAESLHTTPQIFQVKPHASAVAVVEYASTRAYVTVLAPQSDQMRTQLLRTLRVHAFEEFIFWQKHLKEAAALFGPEQSRCDEADGDEVKERGDQQKDKKDNFGGVRGASSSTHENQLFVEQQPQIKPSWWCCCCQRDKRPRDVASGRSIDGDDFLVIPPAGTINQV